MRSDQSLSELYGQAATATKAGSKSFYFATRFFPPDLARAAHAVYWFCRFTDDLADEAPTPEQGRRDIEDWDQTVRSALTQGRSDHPPLSLFLEAVQCHGIPHEYPLELIEGMRMDLNHSSYASFAELRVFCYRVASVVGLMMSHVIGFHEPAPEYATDLGIAMQLTNILRDVGEDLDRGRVYLPRDEMAAFGYSPEELRARVRNSAFERLMAFQVRRAREYYRMAEPGIDLLDRRGRFAVKVAARVYREILTEIEAAGYEVFERRAVVPQHRKLRITASAMAFPAVRHSIGKLAFWRP